MKKDFWLERWEHEEIGFNQVEVNSHLRQYWPTLNLKPYSEVFVPLCGKSIDMLWLRKQGHSVLGVELSDIAVQAFFKENGCTPNQVTHKIFHACEAGGIRILCGDFFDLNKDGLAKVTAVYDRAAMIALPPLMRERYVKHLVSIVPPATKILLITFDYAQAEMSGPPFSVSADEVESLYGKHAEIRLLAELDVLAQNLRFQERGLSRLKEKTYLITLR
jgi:thiopurine S-methyltransferase